MAKIFSTVSMYPPVDLSLLRIFHAASHWGVASDSAFMMNSPFFRSDSPPRAFAWREIFSAIPSWGFGRAAEASENAESTHATKRSQRAMACVLSLWRVF